jgi:tetratricopeptide (TPR) repeat protein
MPYSIDKLARCTDAELLQMRSNDLAQSVGRMVGECDELANQTSDQKRELAGALALIGRFESLGLKSDRLFVVKMMTLGKLGRFDEAIAEANAAYVKNPSWNTAISVANACRRRGDLDKAIKMFELAATHDQKDASALLAIGDIHLENTRWHEAIDAYERAVLREADNPWAVPSLCFCRYRLSGDPSWLDRLREFSREKPDECGVADSLARMMGQSPPSQRRGRAKQLLQRA